MSETNQQLNKTIEKSSKIEKHYSFVIGIYLSVLAFVLIILLIFVNMSVAIQQVIVIAIGLLMLISFSAFRQLIEPEAKQSFLDKYQSYFDNRVITYNTVDTREYYYPQKQNLAAAAAEIQQLLAHLSQSYATSIPNEVIIENDTLEIIKDIEIATHEELTPKERVIVAKAVKEIENDAELKIRITNALRTGGMGTFKELIRHPLTSFVLATVEAWQEAETSVNNLTENVSQNR